MKEVAWVCHTFLRDEHMFNAVEHVKRRYPLSRIYLSDGGFMTEKKLAFYKEMEKEGDVVLVYPFDTSPNICRNAFVNDIVEEPFIVKMDDDFYVRDRVMMEEMVRLLKKKKDLGIVGMKVEDDHKASSYIFDIDWEEGEYLHLLEAESETEHYGALRYKYCDVVPDCFVAKREIFPECNWDEDYDIGEGMHIDFFCNVKYNTDWRVVYAENSVMWHDKDTGNSPLYTSYRRRHADLKGTDHRHKLKRKWKAPNLEYKALQ